MTARTEPKKARDKPRLGNLPPRFNFFLNPYTDVRFTTCCPGCSGRTSQRKLPLAIHVHGWGMVMLNKTCRLCPHCDLLIAHKDEIELHLAQLRLQMGPAVIGNDYLIVGTVERKDSHRGLTKPLTPDFRTLRCVANWIREFGWTSSWHALKTMANATWPPSDGNSKMHLPLDASVASSDA